MRRYVGQLLMGTGALHALLGVLGFRRTLVEIHRARYLDTIGRDPEGIVRLRDQQRTGGSDMRYSAHESDDCCL